MVLLLFLLLRLFLLLFLLLHLTLTASPQKDDSESTTCSAPPPTATAAAIATSTAPTTATNMASNSIRNPFLQRSHDDFDNDNGDLGQSMPSFRAAQYNILSSYLGSNTEPWFLYGGLNNKNNMGTAGMGDGGSNSNSSNRSEEEIRLRLLKQRADAIALKHRERDDDGNYINVGWPNYVKGILSEEEIVAVEEHHAQHFDWKVRAPKILQTIQTLNADVLSLVELDRYHDFFKPELHRMGLDSIWVKRPRSSSHDGCAVCWNRSKFDLITHETLTYSDDIAGHRQDRVAVVTLLQVRSEEEESSSEEQKSSSSSSLAPVPGEPGTQLIFVSTHLARNPECPQQDIIRQRQVVQLQLKLRSFAERHNLKPTVPAVVAGDLNNVGMQQMRAMMIAFFSLRFQRPPPLFCVMEDVPTPPTSFTLLRQMRIDYLFHSSMLLTFHTPVTLPTINNMEEFAAHGNMTIPNKVHPSDHLPIAADFQFKTEKQLFQDSAYRFCMALLTGDMDRPVFPAEILMAFHFFDDNRTGIVSAKQIANGVRRLGIADVVEDQERKLQDLLCTFFNPREKEEDDKDDEEEPVATLATFHGALEHFLASWEDAWVKKAFHSIDTNGDGVVSRAEWVASIGALYETAVPDEDLNALFDSIDVNKDGLIQIDEFLTVVRKAHTDSKAIPV